MLLVSSESLVIPVLPVNRVQTASRVRAAPLARPDSRVFRASRDLADLLELEASRDHRVLEVTQAIRVLRASPVWVEMMVLQVPRALPVREAHPARQVNAVLWDPQDRTDDLVARVQLDRRDLQDHQAQPALLASQETSELWVEQE